MEFEGYPIPEHIKGKMGNSFLHKLIERLDAIATHNSFDRPIFIIAPPRAGSTFLFECLSQFNELHHLIGREAEHLWWQCFPYEKKKDPSDYLGREYATAENIKKIHRLFYKEAVAHYFKKCPEQSRSPYLFGRKRIRYLDKTISNCFHLEFLERAFPDARYIILAREPRANISSMIEGWPQKRFGKPQLNSIVRRLSTTVEHWTYPAPPGWQEIVSKPLPEICAWSWMQHIEYVSNFFDKSSKEVFKVKYEDLLDNTVEKVAELAGELGLVLTAKIEGYLKNPPLSRTTVSQPYRNKWKDKHYEAIMSILPIIEGTAKRIDYDLSI